MHHTNKRTLGVTVFAHCLCCACSLLSSFVSLQSRPFAIWLATSWGIISCTATRVCLSSKALVTRREWRRERCTPWRLSAARARAESTRTWSAGKLALSLSHIATISHILRNSVNLVINLQCFIRIAPVNQKGWLFSSNGLLSVSVLCFVCVVLLLLTMRIRH